MIRAIVIGAVALLLAGCTTTAGSPEARQLAAQVPPDYRQQVVSYLERTLRDPYSIRSAEISAPTSVFVGLINGGNIPGVCVRLNARNAFGAYTGIQTWIVGFKNGQAIGAGQEVFADCADERFEAFPELEQIA